MSETKTFLVVLATKHDERKIVDWFVSSKKDTTKKIKEILDSSNTNLEDVAYGNVYEIVSNDQIDLEELEGLI